ncbi:zinc finger RNA-binding protein-like [Tubulanus polymorphus]|uniref:zinc finger RNA-binding protein-like n=1 Tax=Tubulanus polymorphus TaxID=672921 RepID=UPI003DA34E86
MAANNYFGFTHGGTQYSAQATAYPAAAAQGYVQPAAPAAAYATAAPPRTAPTYESYQSTTAAATGQQYAYPARQPVSTVKVSALQTAIAPVTTPTYPDNYYARATTPYEAPKAYYQPTAQTSFAASNTQYQTLNTRKISVVAKPAYSTTATSYQTNAQRAAPKANYVYQSAAATTQPTSYTSTPSYSNTTSAGTGYTGVANAVYSAATNYYQQTQQHAASPVAKPASAAWKTRQPFNKAAQKPKPQPKQMQLHYCDVCKISCAGPQTYREHLEGQKHKKKEKVAAVVPRGGQNQLCCELCDVTCTGTDAYAAHIRGAKHCKVMKLHTILGKPIPSTEPVLITTSSNSKTSTSNSSPASTEQKSTPKPAPAKTPAATSQSTAQSALAAKKVVSQPKITFVGGNTLKSTTPAVTANTTAAAKPQEVKVEAKVDAEPMATDKTIEQKKVSLAALQENETQPVGHEYIEEVKNEAGKVVSFQCKLCECKFNDPNAKEMHLKGRRHRLQYKKKVDPYLQVEVKPSLRARKQQEDKHRRQMQKEEFWKRRDQEERWREEMREMEAAMQWQGGGRGPMSGPGFGRLPMGPMRRPDTSDDRHVMAKHASIYPNEAELQAVQSIVSACEKALKQVSDFIAEEDCPTVKTTEAEAKPAAKKVKKEEESKEGETEDSASAPPRALKGVMRVGVLAKGLLLHGDLHVHLVVLCSEKPTRTLLERVYDNLPKQLTAATEEKYSVRLSVEEAAIVVCNEIDPRTSCTITLTSPIMREENIVPGESDKLKDPPDVLDRQKCLNALAALRHAKWFQARANGLQSCVVVIRILRDLCQRVPTWAPLNEWAMELLVEKCVGSGGPSMSPGDALRRVFECIASGILLPGGPGLYDPCEKDATDAAASLTNQEREDITASAQHALRLIAFRQIHKVLGMDALPAPRFSRNRFNSRKRRRTNSTGDGSDVADGKKDKKEEEGMETTE